MAKCPVCGQLLPKALNKDELQIRLVELTADVRARERQALESDFRKRLPGLLEAERRRARRFAEYNVRNELLEAKRRADKVERDKDREIERMRREAERTADHRAAMAARRAAKHSQADLRKLQDARERDRVRSEGERARLQGQLDQLSRRLEKQTGEQLGAEAEVDLLTELNRAFRGDRIVPVRRGAKGADIVHDIMEDARLLGRIVYESKNVSSWQNKFITQAKHHQIQYDTPNVIIVTRSFPQKKKGLCSLKNIPIVDPRMAVCLASIMRDGILEIGRARATRMGRNEKANQLFEYIVSDKFATRFRAIAEGVETLRERQQKERDWHENAWGEESNLYDKIDSRRREVDSQIKTIIRNSEKPQVVRLAARQ